VAPAPDAGIPAGLAVVAVALQGSAGVHDDVLFSAHMVQHLLLIMAAPPLLVFGRPVTLLWAKMSEVYSSTLDISFDVRGGLLIWQIHHWAALLFAASISVHLLRVFFTGAFRKPREINWIMGTVMFALAAFEGFAGYSLPDDLLSGTGIRIADGIVLSIPVVGTYLSFFVFGGQFPGEHVIPTFTSSTSCWCRGCCRTGTSAS
jgi:quinol-cytochrome oxidoreductase complex cytochrome b subunit